MTLLPTTFHPIEHHKIDYTEIYELESLNSRQEYLETVKNQFLLFCSGPTEEVTESARLSTFTFFEKEGHRLLMKETYFHGLQRLILKSIDCEHNELLKKVIDVWLALTPIPEEGTKPLDEYFIGLYELSTATPEYYLSRFIQNKVHSTCIQMLFIYSLIRSNSVAAEIFLKLGANPNSKYEYYCNTNTTALEFAVTKDDEAMVKVILNNGGNSNIGDKNLVDIAARKGFLHIKKTLEDSGAKGSTPIMSYLISKL